MEKFKITETLEDLKKDEKYWPILQLMVVSAIKGEEKQRGNAKVVEFLRGEPSGLMDMVNVTTYVKTFSWLQYTLLSKHFHGQNFSKKEFLEALVYNSQLYQDIVSATLDNKDSLKESLLALLMSGKVETDEIHFS